MSARTTLPDAVHDRLFFAQVREDPRAELDALRPAPSDEVVVVSSGGCTALSLLAAGAGRVTAVDLNATQNHLVELKTAATALGGRAAIAFLGALPSSARHETYASLRGGLTPEARRYWDDRPRAIETGVLRTGVSERFIGAVVSALLLAVHPRARVERLLACRTLEEQRTLFEREWSTTRWRALFALLCNRLVLRNTYPPQFFAHVENPSFALHFRRLAEHAITELPVSSNYFLHQMLEGRYPVEQPDGVPPYLSERGAAEVMSARDRLELVDGGMTTHLRSRPERSVHAFALSNICEWMTQPAVDALFREVLRTAAPGARLVYRNFVGWTELPAWCERIVPDEALGARLSREDRSLVQRRVVACHVEAA
jgi:S-adenosylmethionine-diacylglycerol 3-amino-3-carboxypropyl transferase